MSPKKKRNQPYPWDDWFKRLKRGDVSLTRGVDFRCQVHSFGVLARTKATQRDVAIRVLINEKVVTLRRMP